MDRDGHETGGGPGNGNGSERARPGNSGRRARRQAHEWGGRIGARLEELDTAARAAMSDAVRAVQRRELATAVLFPVLTVSAAFLIGLRLSRLTHH
jgi:hypothetical protein